MCGTYYESWAEPWSATLTALPDVTANIVYLSFAQPDATFDGTSFAGTGLQFSSDASVVKASVAAAKRLGKKVLIAVGGASYTNWAGLNANALANLVSFLGADGVDIDYEPASPQCTPSGCASDAEYIMSVTSIRAALPRPFMVTAAVWSTGAYTQGQPPTGQYSGVAVNMLRSAGALLDYLNLMSYDAGTQYSPPQALQAYQNLFSGPILVGYEVPPEAWGGHVVTLSEVIPVTSSVGAFTWAWYKQGTPDSRALLGAAGC